MSAGRAKRTKIWASEVSAKWTQGTFDCWFKHDLFFEVSRRLMTKKWGYLTCALLNSYTIQLVVQGRQGEGIKTRRGQVIREKHKDAENVCTRCFGLLSVEGYFEVIRRISDLSDFDNLLSWKRLVDRSDQNLDLGSKHLVFRALLIIKCSRTFWGHSMHFRLINWYLEKAGV